MKLLFYNKSTNQIGPERNRSANFAINKIMIKHYENHIERFMFLVTKYGIYYKPFTCLKLLSVLDQELK